MLVHLVAAKSVSPSARQGQLGDVAFQFGGLSVRLSRSVIVATSLLVLVTVVTYLFFPHIRPVAQISTTPSLAAYGADLQQTSVSGVSSGAGMALQFHVAHSSIMRGVGIIAGVAYDCSDFQLPSVLQRVARGLNCRAQRLDCMAGLSAPPFRLTAQPTPRRSLVPSTTLR